MYFRLCEKLFYFYLPKVDWFIAQQRAKLQPRKKVLKIYFFYNVSDKSVPFF